MALRLAFFGLPLAALLLERDGHDLGIVCLSRTDTVGLRRAKKVFGDRLVVKPSARDAGLRERVKALSPDLLVSWFWTTKLPMSLVGCARLGGVGVHPSLLPRHRGPDPTYWAIKSGDRVTGVTAHRIAAEYDTGEILDQEELAINPAWNAWLLARALDRPSLRLLRKTVAKVARCEPLVGRAQDPALATEAPLPDDEACALRWASSTDEVLRHVRALAPSPGAWTEVDEHVVTILRASPAAKLPSALEPGEGAVMNGIVLIRTADGAIVIEEAEVDGVPVSRADLAALFLSRQGLG